MSRFIKLLTVTSLWVFGSAGCPMNNVLDATSILPGGTGDTSGSNSTTRGTQALSDDLTSAYPKCTEPAEAASWRARILQLVNQERANRGLGTLTRNATLEDQATEYACEMIQYEFFDHENPVTGSTLGERAEQFRYDYLVIGENLAAGQRTPEEAFTAWMNSEGHRENILDPRFTELGIAVRSGGRYGLYWVQEFGRPNTRTARNP